MPKVSVIVPAYNVAPWIEETLESVARQTFSDFECIIVDDKSTDSTCDIVKSWIKRDKRFRIIYRDVNGGLSAARNSGIDIAQGEYIALLDSDDMWHPTFLEKMLSLIEKNDAWIAYSRFAMFVDGTNIRKPLAWDNLFRTGNIWWDMLVMSEFHVCSWLGKIDVVRSAGPFDISLRSAQDRDFLLRLLAIVCEKDAKKVCGTDEELFFYRQRPSSTIYTKGKQTIRLEWDFMPRHLDHPGVPAAVRRRGYSFLAFKMGIISLNVKEYSQAFRWFGKAIFYDPLNINLLWLPLRKVYLKLAKNKFVTFK